MKIENKIIIILDKTIDEYFNNIHNFIHIKRFNKEKVSIGGELLQLESIIKALVKVLKDEH